jgi:hypothetical protein
MHVAHIGLYDHYVCITNEEEKSNVYFEPPMPVLQLKKRNPIWVLKPHASITKKEKKSNVCFEALCRYCIRKFSMCFANDMQKFHTLYLSNTNNSK